MANSNDRGVPELVPEMERPRYAATQSPEFHPGEDGMIQTCVGPTMTSMQAWGRYKQHGPMGDQRARNQAVRTIVSTTWPDVAFKVRMGRGRHVAVVWTDGPTSTAVRDALWVSPTVTPAQAATAECQRTMTAAAVCLAVLRVPPGGRGAVSDVPILDASEEERSLASSLAVLCGHEPAEVVAQPYVLAKAARELAEVVVAAAM